MKSEEFLQILSGIDEDFIDSVGKDLEHFRSGKSANSLSEKAHRKPVWKNVAAAAVCTAAAIFGVFALLLGTGRIKLESGAGVSLNASSGGLYFPINEDYQLDLSEETSGRCDGQRFIIPVQMAPEVLFFQQPVQRTGPLIIGRP